MCGHYTADDQQVDCSLLHLTFGENRQKFCRHQCTIGRVGFLHAETENHVLEGGGISRTITVSKEDALAASADDYAAFVSGRLPLGKNNLELFGMVFDDGTGITYYGCSASNAVYGRITSKGVSVDASGYISPNEDGTYSYVEYEN